MTAVMGYYFIISLYRSIFHDISVLIGKGICLIGIKNIMFSLLLLSAQIFILLCNSHQIMVLTSSFSSQPPEPCPAKVQHPLLQSTQSGRCGFASLLG